MKFSYGLPAAYPAREAVDLIRTADDLGFHGCYLADDPRARDPWLLCAAAAAETESIRLGFSATHVYLREPTFIAQALATLDELSGGRAEAAISFGDPPLLDTYHVDWRGKRSLARVREAIAVMRAYLDRGEVTHDGEFFRYSGLSTTARPVQQHLPLLIGALGGPESFRLAGEVADGVHCSGTSAENSRFVVEQVRQGAEKVGRDWAELDIAALCIVAVADDAEVAREAARVVVAGWIASFPRNLIERSGLDYEEVRPIGKAMSDGRIDEALSLTSAPVGDALSIAGTPEECAEEIRRRIVQPGIDHLVMVPADPTVVGLFGRRIDGLPDAADQLRLIHDRLFPLFTG